jgi:hypothetical protein
MEFNKLNYNTQGELIIDDNIENTNKWEIQKGKKVILIEPDIPWYVDKQKSEAMSDVRSVTPKNQSNDFGDARRKFILDLNKPDLGYGYSYAQRLGKPCTDADETLFENDNTENFNDGQTIDFNSVASILLLILVFIVIIRSCLKTKL